MKRDTKFTDMSIKDQDKSKTVKFTVNKETGITECTLHDRISDAYYTGRTRCHDVDVFDEKKGRAIAFNKARKRELEANLKSIEMEKAKIDEWYRLACNTLEKRTHINIVYLTGVNDELKDLMK